tara:strand:+ start:493 stop:891 length:399 start_codon:yes stop_codon:yes gene_type:complete
MLVFSSSLIFLKSSTSCGSGRAIIVSNIFLIVAFKEARVASYTPGLSTLFGSITYFYNIYIYKIIFIIYKFYNNKLEKIIFEKSGDLDSGNPKKKKLIGKCNILFIYPRRHTTTNKNLCSSIKHRLADKKKY